MIYTIQNEHLRVQISTLGAELQSIQSTEGREYLWHGDPEYWSGRAPILFPLVGNVWNKQFCHKGQVYDMPAHGFARNAEYTAEQVSDTELRFTTCSTEETLRIYPFSFRLEIIYRLEGRHLINQWLVTNTGNEEMHFRIGGHPALLWDTEAEELRGSIAFDTEGPLQGTLLDQKGCVHRELQFFEEPLQAGGVFTLHRDYFDPIDTLILENSQVRRATLRDNKGEEILTMTFDAPVFCIWTPTAKGAPFVCLEPWYGRCDRNGDVGEFAERDYMNHVEPAATWQGGYELEFK